MKVGNLLYAAGQVGRDANMNVIDSSLEDHFVAVWDHLGAVLRAGGSDFEHIIEITTFPVGLQDHLELFLEVRTPFVPKVDVPHAWSAIGIPEFTFPGKLVDLKSIADIP